MEPLLSSNYFQVITFKVQWIMRGLKDFLNLIIFQLKTKFSKYILSQIMYEIMHGKTWFFNNKFFKKNDFDRSSWKYHSPTSSILSLHRGNCQSPSAISSKNAKEINLCISNAWLTIWYAVVVWIQKHKKVNQKNI